MRVGLGTALLLASTSLVGLTSSPVAAVTGCEDPDTTWIGPATPDGSASWADAANWTSGVPTATSAVCISYTGAGPHVPEGTRAEAATMTLEGTLTLAGSLEVATLEGGFGELRGPGTTTVTGRLFGDWLTLGNAAVVELHEHAALGGEIHVYDGSTLNVEGDTVLEPDARIDSLSENPGLLTIAATGSLTFASANESAEVIGGFANHGAVTATAGNVLMVGASREDAHPGQFSTGTFTGSPEATFNLANTELRSDALLNHVTWVDHINVPADNTVTVAGSRLLDLDVGPDDPAGPPSITGAGKLVVTDGTVLGARIGGSLSVTVPADEVVNIAGTLRDQAHLQVHGEVVQGGDLYLDDEAVLDIYGTHRMADGASALVDFAGDDPGVEVIHPGGLLAGGQGGGLVMVAPFVNQGTVDSEAGQIHIGPRVESPSPSTGTFRAGPIGGLALGSNVSGEPSLNVSQAIVEGDVRVLGKVLANGLDVRGSLTTQPTGQLTLSGITTLNGGASIAGNVTSNGQLEADLGATGSATLTGLEVLGSVHAVSGTLNIPSLGPSTLSADGTLSKGRWTVWNGATLDLPGVTTNATELSLLGPRASFGDGLTTLTEIGPNGTLLLGGGDLALPGPLRNEGNLHLDSGSRLDVNGKFRQLATGTLTTHVDSAGRGRVRAEGLRDLAGKLVVDRDPAYEPSVGTVLSFITSNGRKDADDAFDSVISPRYGTRKIRVDYGVDRVRLRVDRVG